MANYGQRKFPFAAQPASGTYAQLAYWLGRSMSFRDRITAGEEHSRITLFRLLAHARRFRVAGEQWKLVVAGWNAGMVSPFRFRFFAIALRGFFRCEYIPPTRCIFLVRLLWAFILA
jgi:hypothetical protein